MSNGASAGPIDRHTDPVLDSFQRRQIDVSFRMGTGDFGEDDGATEAGPPSDTIKITGHRVSAQISESGTYNTRANVSIFGMNQSNMNKLSTLGLLYPYLQNSRNWIMIQVGDARSSIKTVVFQGAIEAAFQNYQNMPDVSFDVAANVGGWDVLKPPEEMLSYTGDIPVATALENIVLQMDKKLINYGVDVRISNMYFSGSLGDQIDQICKAANINKGWTTDGKSLEIWPPGGQREFQQPQLVSPATGMIGYPTYTANGLIVRTIFNPNIRKGRYVHIDTTLPRAKEMGTGTFKGSGDWQVGAVTHSITAEIPGGAWSSHFDCADPGVVANIAPGVSP